MSKELSLIQSKILNVNGYKVLLDFDLAALYDVENRTLKQAVRRNLKRFPDDFMFQLSKEAWKEVITSCDNLPEGVKYSPTPPFAFTEQGVAMLSSILNSEKAIAVNVSIIRAFVALRQHLTDYADLKERVTQLEKSMDVKFQDFNQVLNYLLEESKAQEEHGKRTPIGFKRKGKKRS